MNTGVRDPTTDNGPIGFGYAMSSNGVIEELIACGFSAYLNGVDPSIRQLRNLKDWDNVTELALTTSADLDRFLPRLRDFLGSLFNQQNLGSRFNPLRFHREHPTWYTSSPRGVGGVDGQNWFLWGSSTAGGRAHMV